MAETTESRLNFASAKTDDAYFSAVETAAKKWTAPGLATAERSGSEAQTRDLIVLSDAWRRYKV